ncbi:threonine/serine ThrE exporter family protein [Miniphocaeibacter halophilus]|uniref:Threonine/serine exporter family protein n=1 Tax=Miniphocaeibacter halophilus TaxID=2931922 RepID=A0AC61MRR7_9FIRM|nr:threonine/serine exporter family protein [Miniphocaeibacter halophilus]QQK06881.1 threonine/serine exporter family protein [Miniphocaeibacter halophilus]
MELEKLLDCSTNIGYLLLSNGAEVYRVEQSIEYICKAYKVEEVNAFALLGNLIVTIEKDGKSVTKSKRINNISTDLDNVEQLIDLSRYISKNSPDYEEINKRILKITNSPKYSTAIYYIGSAVIAAPSFVIFFGGTFKEAFLTIPIAIIITFLKKFLNKAEISGLFVNIVSGLFLILGTNLIEYFFTGINTSNIILGALMLLVPGLALANAMRDMIMSDTISGLSRLIDALLTAVGIAIGLGIGMYFI